MGILGGVKRQTSRVACNWPKQQCKNNKSFKLKISLLLRNQHHPWLPVPHTYSAIIFLELKSGHCLPFLVAHSPISWWLTDSQKIAAWLPFGAGSDSSKTQFDAKHCQRLNGPEGWVHITISQLTVHKFIPDICHFFYTGKIFGE